jgi:uncharacterized protein involved in exopolysaccharide biosynthesis
LRATEISTPPVEYSSGYLPALRKWLWLPIVLGLAATGVAAFITLSAPPVYQAKTTVQVVPIQGGSQSGYQTIDQTAKTYAQLMTTQPLLQQVIKDVQLTYTVDELQSNLTVTPQLDTGLIDVKMQDTDPAKAANVVNMIVKDFDKNRQAQQKQQDNASITSLQTQMGSLEKQISDETRLIAQLQAKVRPSADDQAQLAILQQKQPSDAAVYASLVKNYDQLKSNGSAAYALTVVERATPPDQPIKSSRVLKILLAGVLGVVVGIGVIYMLASPTDKPRPTGGTASLVWRNPD